MRKRKTISSTKSNKLHLPICYSLKVCCVVDGCKNIGVFKVFNESTKVTFSLEYGWRRNLDSGNIYCQTHYFGGP